MQIPRAFVGNVSFSSAIENTFNSKEDDNPTIYNDKVHQLALLYAKYVYKDKEEPVDGKKLVGCQHQRYQAIGLVVFGFALHKQQIDAISYLFYKQTDLFLFPMPVFAN